VGILEDFSERQQLELDWGLSDGVMPDFSKNSVVVGFLNWATQQPSVQELEEVQGVMQWDAESAQRIWEHMLSTYEG
jgi:hypothetical protein